MPTQRPSSTPPPEVVNPLWLVKAVALTVVSALVCAWLALCLLFYQGQWQLVLHPQRTTEALDLIGGNAATPIRFDAADSGVPRLSGTLMLPNEPTGFAPYTVLYLRGGESSLAHSPWDAATISMLHSLGLRVFAFDYGGFGASDPTRPNLQRMTRDTRTALHYLLSRGIPEDHVVLYGTGVGASLATALAASSPAIPVLILDSPTPPSLAIVLADPRTRALPVRWLFHEDFSLDKLSTLGTPKLLISFVTPGTAPAPVFTSAATPKTTLELPYTDRRRLSEELKRFLDQYLVSEHGRGAKT